jgi:predicted nucleic acid-binding protein
MRVLLDMNVLLDVLLARPPWLADAGRVWDAHRNGQIVAGIAAFTVPTVFYVVRRQTDLNRAHDAVRIALHTFEIVAVSRTSLDLARTYSGNDFEDNLQLACAIESKMDALVTRDPAGFPGAPIPILTPADLLARLGTP